MRISFRKKISLILIASIVMAVALAIELAFRMRPAAVVYKTENVKCGDSEVVLGTFENKTRTQDPVLLFYFHGLGQTYTEPFKLPVKRTYAQSALQDYPLLNIVSCNYSENIVWYNQDTLASATCGITHILDQLPAAHIILAGTSMGGCAALTYAAIAPEEIRKRIIGVVAVYATGDLARLYKLTQEKRVTDGLLNRFGGPPEKKLEQYNDSSLVPNLSKLPNNIHVYLISASHDVAIPTVLQAELYKTLQDDHVICKLETFEGTHESPPISGSFERGLHFVLDGMKL